MAKTGLGWGDVKVLDKPLRDLLKRYGDQVAGKRTWPIAKSFMAYKTRIIREPFQKKGIDSNGRENTWADNEDSTVINKYGLGRGEKHPIHAKNGEIIGWASSPWDPDAMVQIKRNEIKIPPGLKRKSLMVGRSRKLINGLEVRFKKVGKITRGPEFFVTVTGAANRYAYAHLHGMPGKLVKCKGKDRHYKSGKVVQGKDYTRWTHFPARPWAAWTPKDIIELRRQVNEWAIAESKKAGG